MEDGLSKKNHVLVKRLSYTGICSTLLNDESVRRAKNLYS